MKNPREARAPGIQKDNRALAKLQDEKSSMDEADYLLASPNNAAHLRKALKDFQNGQRNFASLDKITYLGKFLLPPQR